MKVGELMTREFETVHPEATVHEVAARIASARSLPVCERGRLIGMVSGEDLSDDPPPGWEHEVPLRGERPARFARIRERIAPDVVYCLESTEVEEAVALMRENSVDRLPVLDARKQLVGMLELSDCASGTLEETAGG